jgi:hypothetical protein
MVQSQPPRQIMQGRYVKSTYHKKREGGADGVAQEVLKKKFDANLISVCLSFSFSPSSIF